MHFQKTIYRSRKSSSALITAITCLTVAFFAFGVNGTQAANAQEFDHTHAQLSKVLKQYVVVQGPVSTVRYAALTKDATDLNAYVTSLTKVTRPQYDKFSQDQKMAYLINAYNALTLKLIVDNYPVKSIKKIGSVFSSPWKKKFFKLFGKESYLDQIEHEILRKDFKEPRVHFAVNCASIGCPALRAEAFTADRLNIQLEEQAKLFLQDTKRNSLDLRSKTITLSKIFDWFDDDFSNNGMTVYKFVAAHMTSDKGTQDQIAKGDFKISYSDYDWNLNESK